MQTELAGENAKLVPGYGFEELTGQKAHQLGRLEEEVFVNEAERK
jgi:hypothetical protein